MRAALNESGEMDEALVERLVAAFYAKAKDDPLLGPVFQDRIQDWDPHLKTIVDFWTSIILKRSAYKGQPMTKHVELAIDARHFDRWLSLWAETAKQICPETAANRFIDLSQRIGESLELGLAGRRGVLLLKGERLPPIGED